MAVNMFADMTPEEFKMRMGFRRDLQQPSNAEPVLLDTNDNPASIDWRELKAVTSVKDQG